jgi:L-threonylcarbamoyladenylate synthase
MPIETLITDSAEVAAEVCRGGQPVAFPTETVYGLGARLSDEAAINQIYAIKGRPSSNPLIAHLHNADQIDQLASHIPDYARTFIKHFVPGPLTLVFKRHPRVPRHAFPGLDTIGVRVPDHRLARDFIARVGEPVVAPSANRSGRPSPTRWQDVEADLRGSVACILKGDPARRGLESTVIDCTGDRPLILRPGSVTLEELRSMVPGTSATTAAELLARSPGTRFRHYAPRANVVLVDAPPVDPPPKSVYLGITPPASTSGWLATFACDDVPAYAELLYRALREADAREADWVFCQRVEPRGLGVAIMDRLERAAAG